MGCGGVGGWRWDLRAVGALLGWEEMRGGTYWGGVAAHFMDTGRVTRLLLPSNPIPSLINAPPGEARLLEMATIAHELHDADNDIYVGGPMGAAGGGGGGGFGSHLAGASAVAAVQLHGLYGAHLRPWLAAGERGGAGRGREGQERWRKGGGAAMPRVFREGM